MKREEIRFLSFFFFSQSVYRPTYIRVILLVHSNKCAMETVVTAMDMLNDSHVHEGPSPFWRGAARKENKCVQILDE